MKIFCAVIVMFAIGVSGCGKPRPQWTPEPFVPPFVVVQDPPPVQSVPVTPTPQTPGIPTVTLPKDDNAVPVHVTIPPPDQKGVKK